MVKGAEDFINGNWRGSNGHETGQWSAQGGWSTLASCRPHFLFLVLSMVSCEHPRSCSVCPTIFETLTDSMPLLHGYSSRSTIALQRYIRALGPLATGTRRERGGREEEFKEDFFFVRKRGPLVDPLPPSEKLGKRF